MNKYLYQANAREKQLQNAAKAYFRRQKQEAAERYRKMIGREEKDVRKHVD